MQVELPVINCQVDRGGNLRLGRLIWAPLLLPDNDRTRVITQPEPWHEGKTLMGGLFLSINPLLAPAVLAEKK